MKTILLALTASTALASSAYAGITIDGSARLGVKANEVAGSTTTTTALNRVRINFAGEATTDIGLSFGAAIRADNAVGGNAGTAGTQWVSGAFGKISMGDLNGADESAVGDTAGVGVAGLGDYNELSYNSSAHNLGWAMDMGPLSLGVSMDTTVQSGDNMALGASFNTDVIEGVNVAMAAGQSTVGTATQTSISASTTVMGVTGVIALTEDDNGAAADTETMAMSASMNLAGFELTAFQKDMTTVGAVDKTWQGVGASMDMGAGATAKVGLANNDAGLQSMSAGISFSF